MDEAKLQEIEAKSLRAVPKCNVCKAPARWTTGAYRMTEDFCEACMPKSRYPLSRLQFAELDSLDLIIEVRRLTAALDAMRSHLCNVLGWAYEPCDQTVRCPQCGQVWWEQPEAINENWHAAGCEIFAAEVAAGRSVDVRRGVACEKRHHLEAGSPPVSGAVVAVSSGPDLPLDAPGGAK